MLDGTRLEVVEKRRELKGNRRFKATLHIRTTQYLLYLLLTSTRRLLRAHGCGRLPLPGSIEPPPRELGMLEPCKRRPWRVCSLPSAWGWADGGRGSCTAPSGVAQFQAIRVSRGSTWGSIRCLERRLPASCWKSRGKAMWQSNAIPPASADFWFALNTTQERACSNKRQAHLFQSPCTLGAPPRRSAKTEEGT